MSAYRKTECPISRAEFLAQAKSVEVTINGVPTLADVKEFRTAPPPPARSPENA